MAESAITFLLNNLTIWLQEEQTLLGGIRGEVQIIRGELEQMRAFLRVADAREETDPQLKECVRQLREIAYDIEDVLESYMIRFADHNSRGILGLNTKHQMASEIKLIKFRMESVSKTFGELKTKLPESDIGVISGDTCYDGRGNALLLEEADVVGIERPKKWLLEWISMGDYTLKVILVVGMAGLGKTTLVKKVFDDLSTKENIDHHAWVTVSQIFNEKNILWDLITQLMEEVKQALPLGFEAMNVDGLKAFIKKFLQNKKYIIILDDVWSETVWDVLQYVFPRINTHGWGCIIVTTRSNNIGEAACCDNGGHAYHLKPLPPQEVEKLFCNKTFLGGPCPDHLKEIFKNILKRCGGLPLAIIIIGGVLSTKRNQIQEWMKFSLNMESQVEGDTLINRMQNVISLSYYNLPYYLKTCLLYLSIFPEDGLLVKTTIIRLWTAKGFVEEKRGKTIEEIAEGYLNELSNRSVIQVATLPIDGRQARNFRIHDLVREYIISKAIEQNIVATKGLREITLEDRIRRLALNNSFISYDEKIHNMKYLRTLLFISSKDLLWAPILCKLLCSDCRMLKVLDLRGAQVEVIPNKVSKLYHLKYLSLRDTNVSLIPKFIGNFGKLETLDLRGCKVVEMPVEILKLQRLRHLLVYRYVQMFSPNRFDNIQSFEAPYKIGKLLCLQRLCHIVASANLVKEIGKLKELRRLGITNLRTEDGKELCASLGNLGNLNSVCISSLGEGELLDLQYPMHPSSLEFLRNLQLRGRLERLPQWIPSLKALTNLVLAWSRMLEDPLEHLQQGLPNLQVLELRSAYEGEGLSFKSGGFQRLTILRLRSMTGLRWVSMEKGSLPCLNVLGIEDCKAMLDLPEGIEHLTNLNDVGFSRMAGEFLQALLYDDATTDWVRKCVEEQTLLHDDATTKRKREYVEK